MKKILLYAGLIGITLGVLAGLASAQTDPRTLPLVQSGDMQHVGSFTLPAFDRKGAQIEYGGFSLGLSADGKELYFSCIGAGGMVKVLIPSVLDGRQATITEDCTGPANLNAIDPTPSNGINLGGVAWFNGRFLVAAHSYYDADKNTASSHWSGTGWASLTGPVSVSPSAAYGPGWQGGAFLTIPPEWRALIGAPMAMTITNIAIISRSSYGPSFSPFDPATMKASAPLLGYTQANPLGVEDKADPLWNTAAKGFGAFWPAGTGAILYPYSNAPKDWWYGVSPSPSGLVDPFSYYQGVHTSCPTHQVAAYRATDLLDVKNGTKQMYQLRPYAVWGLSDIAPECKQGGLSVAGDLATNRLYVGHYAGAGVSGAQTVHVYQINADTTPPPPPPAKIDCQGVWTETLSDPTPAQCDASQQQTRTRTRTFTATTLPQNGGLACPASPVVDTVTNGCIYTPPPPPVVPSFVGRIRSQAEYTSGGLVVGIRLTLQVPASQTVPAVGAAVRVAIPLASGQQEQRAGTIYSKKANAYAGTTDWQVVVQLPGVQTLGIRVEVP